MTQERFAALQWFVIAAIVAWLAYLLRPILTPFVVASVLTYLCAPLVNRLCAWKWQRTWAVLAVMLLLFVLLVMLLLLVLPLLQRELQMFMQRLPALIEVLRVRLEPMVQQYFHLDLQWDNDELRGLFGSNLQSAGTVAGKVLPWLGGGSAALLGFLMNAVLMPVVLFYLLRDEPDLRARINELIPRRWHGKVSQITDEANAVLTAFLRGEVIVMLLMSAFYALGLWFCGLQFALPIGLLAGLLVILPYVGLIAGLALATLAAAAQFTSFGNLLLVWGVFGAGQILEGMVVTPRLVGDRTGLHPLAVVFSLLAFGQLFGFFGVLLALPMAAVMLVGLRHAKEWYLDSSLYHH